MRTHAANVIKNKNRDQIAIDDKEIRGSKKRGEQYLHSVSAWCHENKLVLSEKQVDNKSNEITAIPILLESLDLKGNTVTIDAAGCQKSIVKLIKEKKVDYVLGLKLNQPKLYRAVEGYTQVKRQKEINKLQEICEEGHGRSVRRRYLGYNISSFSEAKEWLEAKSVVAVETITYKNNDSTHKGNVEWRYYLSSHKHNNKQLSNYVRNHWGIKNKLHWILDIHLKEDNDQKKERKSVRSLALLRRIALNIIRSKDPSSKRSLRGRLKRSGWSNDYLLSLLT